MNAKGARLNVTAKPHANDAGIYHSNAYMRRTAATTSRSQSTTTRTLSYLSLTSVSEFKQMSAQISTLQEQVDQLFANLSSLRNQVDAQSSMGSMGTPFPDYGRPMSMSQTPIMAPSPSQQRSKSFSKHPRFHGPTSSAFNLGVAKTSLKTMGITAHEEGEDEGVVTQDATPLDSPPPSAAMLPKPTLHVQKDPIWSFTKQEAIRLLHVWEEEMGMMYPFMDIQKVVRYAEMLFSFVEAAARSGLMQGGLPGADAIMDARTSHLKLMLASALILEGNGKDPLGERLFDNVHKVVEQTLSSPVDLQGINMLMLAVRFCLGMKIIALISS